MGEGGGSPDIIAHGYHIVVSPVAESGFGSKETGFRDVYVLKDEGGKPQWPPVNSVSLPGGEADEEEIADTIARRLNAGINPKDVFKDVEEAGDSEIKQLLTKWKSEYGGGRKK